MKDSRKNVSGRWLNIDEVRLVSDLRVMHAKADELYQIVTNLKHRHKKNLITEFADDDAMEENIRRIDEIYLWFVELKEEMRQRSKKTG